MILGRVLGQVWATRKSPRLGGRKLLLVHPLAWFRPDHPTGHVVAVDPVGAEVGQDVIVCMGQPARWMLQDARMPVEASVAAIVDRVETYRGACREPAFRFAPGNEPLDLLEREQ